MHKILPGSLKTAMIAGIFFVLIVGTFWHFLYQWSDHSFLIGLIAPVNESPWEHTKLLTAPFFIYAGILKPFFQKKYPCLIPAAILSVLPGIVLIPLLFYLYYFFTGTHYLWADILIFIFSVSVSFSLWYLLAIKCPFTEKEVHSSYALLLLLIFFYILLTVIPPEIPPFIPL